MTRVFAVLLSVACSVTQTYAYADGPLVVAHRGLLRHAPENTLANFRACLELRFGFEFDVERTKDGQLVCIHDGTVDRTTNGTGKVSELTLAQMRELDAGSWFDPKFAGEKVPTIDEVLKLIAEYRQHDVLIAVDLKAANVGEDVVRLAERHKVLDRLLFIGRTISEPELRRNIKEASPEAHTGATGAPLCGGGVESLLFPGDSEGLVVVPVVTQAGGSVSEHGQGSFEAPAHSGAVQSVFDHEAA